jgi:SAM-dependent methyltransferase
MPSSPRKVRSLHRGGSELPMYRRPQLYDRAFGFRDIPAECRGVLALSARYGLAQPHSAIELACGPAHHLRELSRRGLACLGIDINAEMLGYAKALCKRDGVIVAFKRADMRTFTVSRRFDLALCLFDSFAQCVTDRDAIETLRRTGAALRKGGLAFVEFTHPADYFGKGRSRTSERWTQGKGDERISARFSLTRFDPVAETFVASLVITPKARNGHRGSRRALVMRWPQHMWLRGGIRYVVQASACFDIVGWYGDIDPILPLDSSVRAWRMIAVLRRH